MRKRKFNLRYYMLLFVILLALVLTGGGLYLQREIRGRMTRAQSRANIEAQSIQRTIASASERTNVLAAWLKTGSDDRLKHIRKRDFAHFAAALYDDETLSSLQLNPDGVTRYIYPESSNKSLVDQDLLAEGSSEADLLRRVASTGTRIGKIAISGPTFVSYIGLSLNIRKPVYYDSGDLWGYVSAVLAFPNCIERSCLDPLDRDGYQTAVYTQEAGKRPQKIAETLKVRRNAVTASFQEEDTTWTIYLLPKGGWVRTKEVCFLLAIGVLFATVLAAVMTFFRSNQTEKFRELKDDAQTDQMTGLLNHETSAAMIQKEIEGPLGGVLFMIDIDFFKQVNDTAGHLVGDQVLIQVSEALKKTFRRGDVIGRYGGDEFIVYMTGYMTVPDFSVKAGQFQDRVRAIQVAGLDRKITCSMGIARKYRDTADIASMVKDADDALYESKRRGKDCFSIYENASREVFVDEEGEAADRKKGKNDFQYKD